MALFLILLFCFFLSVSGISCNQGEVYIKFIKKNRYYSNTESFELLDGYTLLFTSPSLVDHEERIIEKCVSASLNNQYTLKMKQSRGGTWDGGSWLALKGLYDNIFFKNYMSETGLEVFTVSLYYAIYKSETWKITSGTVSGSWIERVYDDSEWLSAPLGSITAHVSGTQYFRKPFTGLAGIAAYELSLLYRFGVVVYMNGEEVYRDNMPSGTVTPTTSASESYTSLGYHSFIRPGMEVSHHQSILAIELHFPQGVIQSVVDLNAYLALNAPSISDRDCFVYPYGAVLASSHGYSEDNLFDFSTYSSASFNSDDIVNYGLSGAKAFVNGVRVWPDFGIYPDVYSFSMEGSMSLTSPDWRSILSVDHAPYEENTHFIAKAFFTCDVYKYYRAQLHLDRTSFMHELQPLICSLSKPTEIPYEIEYLFNAKFDMIEVKPSIQGFTNCQIEPTPVEGLIFHSPTCTLSGVVKIPVTQVYNVTAIIAGDTYTGSFTLKVIGCAGSVVFIQRKYHYYTDEESFTIQDATTQEVILHVSGKGEVSNAVWETDLCLTNSQYVVTTESTGKYWDDYSYLYIKGVLELGSYDPMLRIHHDTLQDIPSETYFNEPLKFAQSPSGLNQSNLSLTLLIQPCVCFIWIPHVQ